MPLLPCTNSGQKYDEEQVTHIGRSHEFGAALVSRVLNSSKPGRHQVEFQSLSVPTDHKPPTQCSEKAVVIPPSDVGDLGMLVQKTCKSGKRPTSAPVTANDHQRSTVVWRSGTVVFTDATKSQKGTSSFLATGREQVGSPHLGGEQCI